MYVYIHTLQIFLWPPGHPVHVDPCSVTHRLIFLQIPLDHKLSDKDGVFLVYCIFLQCLALYLVLEIDLKKEKVS